MRWLDMFCWEFNYVPSVTYLIALVGNFVYNALKTSITLDNSIKVLIWSSSFEKELSISWTSPFSFQKTNVKLHVQKYC